MQALNQRTTANFRDLFNAAVAELETEKKAAVLKAVHLVIGGLEKEAEEATKKVREAEMKAKAYEKTARVLHQMAAAAGLVAGEFQLMEVTEKEDREAPREKAGEDMPLENEGEGLWVRESDGEEWGIEEKDDEEGGRLARIFYREGPAGASDENKVCAFKKARLAEKARQGPHPRKDWVPIGWKSVDDGEKGVEARRLVGTVNRKRSASPSQDQVPAKEPKIIQAPTRRRRGPSNQAALRSPASSRSGVSSMSPPAPSPIQPKADSPSTHTAPTQPTVASPPAPTPTPTPATISWPVLVPPPTTTPAPSAPTQAPAPDRSVSSERLVPGRDYVRKILHMQRAIRKGRLFEPSPPTVSNTNSYRGRAPLLVERGEVLVTRSARATLNAASAAKAKLDMAFQLALLRLPARAEKVQCFLAMLKARKQHNHAVSRLWEAVDAVIQVGNAQVRAGLNRDERRPEMKAAAEKMARRAALEKALRAAAAEAIYQCE